jgi:methylated-DNA-[protein]-cysteine S-methyltransferase
VIELGAHAKPLGRARIPRRDGRLLRLAFEEHRPAVDRALPRRLGGLAPTTSAEPSELGLRLDAYFAGELAALDALAVELVGTPFQCALWRRLRTIPAGATASYGELARALGVPKAGRAVGAANGANPLWLGVPCHRALGANGALTGYAGGLERKRWLLAHERAELSAPSSRTR